jgi:hypothetical protein
MIWTDQGHVLLLLDLDFPEDLNQIDLLPKILNFVTNVLKYIFQFYSYL